MTNKIAVGFLTSFCLLVLCAGCVSTNARTAFNSIVYPPSRAQIAPSEIKMEKTWLVEVKDARLDKSVWTYPCSMLASWIPLVPGCPYKWEDLLLGSPHQLDEEVRLAAKTHFEVNGLAQKVVQKDARHDYRMTIKINYCAEKGCWTLYGGGIFPLGCWFAIFGAPFKYCSILLDLDVSVCDATGKELYARNFYENVFYCAGEYYNANSLTFLGTGLCNVLNRVTIDMAEVFGGN